MESFSENEGFPDDLIGKESACNAGDPGSTPGSGRCAGEGIAYPLQYSWTFLVAQLVKNLPAVWETWVWSLGWEVPPENGKATHSTILAWRIDIPWKYWKCFCAHPDGHERARSLSLFWKYLSKDLSHQIPWSTESLNPPWIPSESVAGQQLQQHRIQSFQRQMANEFMVTKRMNLWLLGWKGRGRDREFGIDMYMHACMQSHFSLWDPVSCSLPGSSVHGIFQARVLEWVAMVSSKGFSQPKDCTRISYSFSVSGEFFTAEPPKKPLICTHCYI